MKDRKERKKEWLFLKHKFETSKREFLCVVWCYSKHCDLSAVLLMSITTHNVRSATRELLRFHNISFTVPKHRAEYPDRVSKHRAEYPDRVSKHRAENPDRISLYYGAQHRVWEIRETRKKSFMFQKD